MVARNKLTNYKEVTENNGHYASKIKHLQLNLPLVRSQ